MKKLIIIAIALLAISCNKTKDWKCTMELVKEGESFDGEGTDVIFTGTKDEMKKYEDIGTKDYQIGDYSYKQQTTCK